MKLGRLFVWTSVCGQAYKYVSGIFSGEIQNELYYIQCNNISFKFPLKNPTYFTKIILHFWLYHAIIEYNLIYLKQNYIKGGLGINIQFDSWFVSNFKKLYLNEGLRFINDYAVKVICNIFLDLELFSKPGDFKSVDELLMEKGFHRHSAEKPLELMCKWLASANILQQEWRDGVAFYAAVNEIPYTDLDALDRHVIARTFPAGTKLLRLAAKHAKAVFYGQQAGDKLYAEETVADWQAYFSHPGMHVPSKISALYLYQHLLSYDRPVRFLEVGAGSASGTRALYELLAEKGELDRVERFLVSDVTEGFVKGSQQLLEELYPGVDRFSYHILDLNGSIQEQGFEPGSVDIILGVNCLHYIRDWDSQLPQLKQLLRPNGLLASAGYRRKDMAHPFHIELLGSFFEEYWNVVTIPDLRPEFGIMPPENFAGGLLRNGFRTAEIWPERAVWDERIPLDFYCGVVAGKI
jgi:SAM-dependent methyltransferase